MSLLKVYFEICFCTLPFILYFSEAVPLTSADYQRLSRGQSLWSEEKRLALNPRHRTNLRDPAPALGVSLQVRDPLDSRKNQHSNRLNRHLSPTRVHEDEELDAL